MAVVPPRNVWWSYEESHGTSAWLGLLRWDGVSWRHIRLPAGIQGIDAVTQDGHGGLWLLVGNNLVYHYSHRR